MRKKLIAVIFGICVAIISGSASAMQMTQSGDKTVCLTGNIGEANKQIALDVYKYGITSEDIDTIQKEDGELLDVWVTNQQTVSDSDGNYKFEFDVALNSGKYTAHIYAEGITKEPYTFVFVSNEEYKELAKNIKTETADDIADILNDKNKCYILGISEEETQNIDTEKLADIIYNTISETNFDENNRDALWNLTDKAYFVELLNENKTENIFNGDIKITTLDDSGIKDWYGKAFVTEDIQKNFTRRLSGQGFKKYSEYKNKIVQAFVLAVVEDAESVLYIEETLKAFENEIGINIYDSTPESVWNKLSGNNYNNFGELSAAYKKYVDDGDDISSSGGGSPSGGGNSSGGGSSIKVQPIISDMRLPVDNTDKVTLPIEIFDDISSVDWAKEAIIELAEKKIIDGIGNNKFNPYGNVTREQCVKIVVNAFTPSAEKANIGFKDVSDSAWYYEYIQKAYSEKIVSGYSDDVFGIGSNVTRQDMCVMIYNAAIAGGISLNAEYSSGESFIDDAMISDYAKTAVYALKEFGAVSGMGENQFNPHGYATRAEMAKIAYSLIK